MRYLLAAFLAFSSASAGSAADGPAAPAADATCPGKPGPVRLFVSVEGVKSSQGLIAITLYPDDPHRFLAHHGSLYVARVPAHAPVTRTCVRLPSLGTFGLAAYHDADGDHHFGRNAIGMPREAYGFSNNPPTFFGLPSFKSVRFPVTRPDQEMRIRLRYP